MATTKLTKHSSFVLKATQACHLCEQEQGTSRDPHAKLQKYLQDNLLVEIENGTPSEIANQVLEWWKVRCLSSGCNQLWQFHTMQANATFYPTLSRMAQDFLAVQASSVPCERTFSDAGLSDMKRRGRFLPENFSAIQLAKTWYKKERRHQELEESEQQASQRKVWERDNQCIVQQRRSTIDTVDTSSLSSS
jgi:hypothetical protein